jgi:dipeptidyl aminopeptidase/acylaminoacyl peptidase
LLISSNSDRKPTQYYIYTTATGQITGLGSTHPDINPAQMGTRDFMHYQARDGLSIPVYVTMPPNKSNTPMPTIVLVHGGPNVRGSSWEWERDAQFLASRGYVVLQPEYRGSTGFGAAHFKAGWKQWGLAMQDDLADAAKWAIKQGWSDPKRIGIVGASYGGYATLMGLIKNPELFRCGVEWSGVTDLALRFNTPQDDISDDLMNYDLKTLMGDPDTDAEMFNANSPLENAAKLTQPLLMAHGTQDVRVPLVHATAFYNKVSNTNTHVEKIIYPDEGHGWHHEQNSIDFWTHVESFLHKNLQTIE